MENMSSYLEQGVLAMSHAVDDWFDGHFGAVALATYYMIKENDLPEHVQAGLLRNADATLSRHPELLKPYPAEASNPALLEKLLDGFRQNTSNLYASGHGFAMGVLALKALRERPDLLTPSVVNGLLMMIADTEQDKPHRYYGIANYFAITLEEYADQVPEYHSIEDMIRQAFYEIRRVTPNVRIDGQTFHLIGEAMHGLTFAHAILELEQMGYHDIVQAAMKNHRKQMYLNRHRPDYAWEKEIIEPPFVTIFAPEYWEQTYNDPHAIKVPYAAVTLLKHLPQELHAEAEKNTCKILSVVK